MRHNKKGEQGYEAPSGDFLRDLTEANHEIKDIISFLILRRELIRDETLQRLDRETRALVAKLESMKGQTLLEELECFKDILDLHRLRKS
jgi:hypothetical protein